MNVYHTITLIFVFHSFVVRTVAYILMSIGQMRKLNVPESKC
jgi:hypothetical protein